MARDTPIFQPMTRDDYLLVLEELDEVMAGAKVLITRARDYELDNVLPEDFAELNELYERMLAEQRRYTRELIALSRNAGDAAGRGHSSCDSPAPASPATAVIDASET